MTTSETVQRVSWTNDLSFLWLEITGKCNLSCSHCYVVSGPEVELFGTMTFGDWMRVIDEAADLGCPNVQFIGGEPTMHPRLDDLIDHANHRGFEFIEVFTNATRIGKGLVGCFQRCGVHVATSFYSDDPTIHEQITRGEGSWQRTVSGIETVLDAGIPIRVGVTETMRNVGHGVRAIEFLKALGVKNVRIDRERGVGRGNLVHLGGDGERYEELCGECWKGKLCVTSNGEAFPCVFSRATQLGDVRSGLLAILKTTDLADFRQKIRAMHGPVFTTLLDTAASGPNISRDQSAASERCNPDACGPGSCNPASACNPDACGPGSCNPAAGKSAFNNDRYISSQLAS